MVINMIKIEKHVVEQPEQKSVVNAGETSIDTKLEVDLICGGVGFDDGPTENGQWVEESRKNKKNKAKDMEV